MTGEEASMDAGSRSQNRSQPRRWDLVWVDAFLMQFLL